MWKLYWTSCPFNLHPDFSRVPPYPDFSRLLSDFFRVASAQFFGGWQLEKKSSEYLEKSGRDGTLDKLGCRLNGRLLYNKIIEKYSRKVPRIESLTDKLAFSLKPRGKSWHKKQPWLAVKSWLIILSKRTHLDMDMNHKLCPYMYHWGLLMYSLSIFSHAL